MRKNDFQFIAAFFSCLILSYEAMAECKTRGPAARFHGDTIEINSETDNGACGFGFNLYSATMMKSIRITKQPINGVAVATDDFHVNYWAVKGFSGNDNFSVELCANHNGEDGCTILNSKLKITSSSTTDLTNDLFNRLKNRSAVGPKSNTEATKKSTEDGSESSDASPTKKKTEASVDLSKMSATALCMTALNPDTERFNDDASFQPYLIEATRRGLSAKDCVKILK